MISQRFAKCFGRDPSNGSQQEPDRQSCLPGLKSAAGSCLREDVRHEVLFVECAARGRLAAPREPFIFCGCLPDAPGPGRLVMRLGAQGVVIRPFPSCFDKLNAVHRAGRRTEAAPGAARFDHGVQVLGRAGNGIRGTGACAPGAADAVGCADARPRPRHFVPVFRVKRNDGEPCRRSKPRNAARAARGTAVDGGMTLGNGLRIGRAAFKAALAAFGLRKQRVNALGRGMKRRKRHDYQKFSTTS